jgi:hypothetical protein
LAQKKLHGNLKLSAQQVPNESDEPETIKREKLTEIFRCYNQISS